MALRPLEPTEEVMLKASAVDASRSSFNPYYGLVVKDHGWGEPNNDPDIWNVTVLWEDGRERQHHRASLMAWSDIKKEIGAF